MIQSEPRGKLVLKSKLRQLWTHQMATLILVPVVSVAEPFVELASFICLKPIAAKGKSEGML
jgi:hypothetical protein